MIKDEPTITVGILDRRRDIRGRLDGIFRLDGDRSIHGEFSARTDQGIIILSDTSGAELVSGQSIRLVPGGGASFSLSDVTIGIDFHWERKEDQTFRGNLIFLADPQDRVTAINEIPLEAYLTSVISSEMSEAAPMAFLKAHAIISRSWITAMLQRRHNGRDTGGTSTSNQSSEDTVIRWYGQEDHDRFDVCADDHCQRYQGITKSTRRRASEAVDETRGLFLVHKGVICDTRYYKACGGRTENFENAWEDRPVPYLSSVSDAPTEYDPVRTEEDAAAWLQSSPEAYCNTADLAVLKQILPDFDQETTDFFRWQVVYSREELEDILGRKSDMDFGTLLNLIPMARGPSGRIYRLKIEGSKKSLVVGKELEIRRWLSRTHLMSSAFTVLVDRDPAGIPVRFTFKGGGWGHGVGLCQIGAAVMASRGFMAEEILRHYFRGAMLMKLY